MSTRRRNACDSPSRTIVPSAGRPAAIARSNSCPAGGASVLASSTSSLTIAIFVPASVASSCAYARSRLVARYSVPIVASSMSQRNGDDAKDAVAHARDAVEALAVVACHERHRSAARPLVRQPACRRRARSAARPRGRSRPIPRAPRAAPLRGRSCPAAPCARRRRWCALRPDRCRAPLSASDSRPASPPAARSSRCRRVSSAANIRWLESRLDVTASPHLIAHADPDDDEDGGEQERDGDEGDGERPDEQPRRQALRRVTAGPRPAASARPSVVLPALDADRWPSVRRSARASRPRCIRPAGTFGRS